MTDNILDGASGAEGSSQPSGQATEADGQQHSGGDAALQQRLDELNKTVKGLSAELNTLKSGKDRSVNETRKELASMKASVGDIERLMKERGIGLGEAVNLIENSQVEDEFKQNVRELVQHLRGGGALPGGNGAVDVSKVIAEKGLDPKDPEVIAAFHGRQFATTEQAAIAALELKVSKATKPQPSDADAVSPSGRTPRQGNRAELENRYVELSKNYSKNEAELRAIEKQLEAMGDN